MNNIGEDKKPESIEELTDEQKEIAKEYQEESIKLHLEALREQIPAPTNRQSRREKLRWLHKQLEVHKRKKPKVSHDPNEDISEKELVDNVSRMRAWVTRYGIIIRQINELEHYGS